MTQPRPALRRAPDAEVHPALVVLPDAGSATVVLPDQESGRTEQGEDKKPKSKKSKRAKAKKSTKNKKAKSHKKAKLDKSPGAAGSDAESGSANNSAAGFGKFRGAGRATSDVLIGSRAQQTNLKVRIPVELEVELRGAAAASGADVDELLAEILAAWLAAPERW